MATESAACERCGGTGWVLEALDGRKQARACSCQGETRKRERLDAAGIPDRYRDDNFANFADDSPILVRAKQTARDFVDSYPAVDSGLLLVGPAGRGKTHLACAILSDRLRLSRSPARHRSRRLERARRGQRVPI